MSNIMTCTVTTSCYSLFLRYRFFSSRRHLKRQQEREMRWDGLSRANKRTFSATPTSAYNAVAKNELKWEMVNVKRYPSTGEIKFCGFNEVYEMFPPQSWIESWKMKRAINLVKVLDPHPTHWRSRCSCNAEQWVRFCEGCEGSQERCSEIAAS